MAQVRSYVRLWPIAFALVGIAGLSIAAYRWMSPPPEDEETAAPEEPVVDAGPNEHFEKVRPHLVDEYQTFVGKVSAEGVIRVSAYDDMQVPIFKIHKEAGDEVKKGDVLVSLHRPQIERAIEQARAKGDSVNEQRFRTYLENADVKAPTDGVVLGHMRTLGEIPIKGIGLVEMTDIHGFRFTVQVPAEVQKNAMALSTKFEIELAEDKGKVKGSVTQFKDSVGEDIPVVLALEPHSGIEAGLDGTIRVPAGRREAGLVPKSAVQRRDDIPYVRVYDAESKSITEKTVRLGEESGADVVILAGVYAGESVIVPGKLE